MKQIAVYYATREGHTRRIAQHVAIILESCGFTVKLTNVRDDASDLVPGQNDAVVLAASVHFGRHETEMVRFVKKNVRELGRLPSAFISVSASQASVEQLALPPRTRDRFAVDVWKAIQRFSLDTGWSPSKVKPVGGALLSSRYNPLIRFAIKRIAKGAGLAVDLSHDQEFTNWNELDRFIREFAQEISGRSIPAVPKRAPEPSAIPVGKPA